MAVNKFNRQTIKHSVNSQIEIDVNSTIIRIAQWNVFAQGFVEADNYEYCRPQDLSWKNREPMFRNELALLNADIYCLQEADIHRHLEIILNDNSQKFQDIFIAKALSPCMLYTNNVGPDGLSMIYNTEKLEVLKGTRASLDDKNNYTALLVAFEVRARPSQRLVVVTTHLKSKKSFSAVRGEQMRTLLAKVDCICSEFSPKLGPVVLCGDFNAGPHNEPAIDMLRTYTGRPYVELYEELNCGIQKDDSESAHEHYTTWSFRKAESDTRRQRPGAAAQYKYVVAARREQSEVIDYIWYSNPSIGADTILRPLSLLAVPNKDNIGPHGIPAPDIYPSDHISLLAEFLLQDQ